MSNQSQGKVVLGALGLAAFLIWSLGWDEPERMNAVEFTPLEQGALVVSDEKLGLEKAPEPQVEAVMDRHEIVEKRDPGQEVLAVATAGELRGRAPRQNRVTFAKR